MQKTKVNQQQKTAAWATAKPENMLSLIIHNNPSAVIDFLQANYEDIEDEMSMAEIFEQCKAIANESGNPGAWLLNFRNQIGYNRKGEAWTLIHQ